MTTRGTGKQFDEIAENAIAKGVMSDLMHALVLIGRRADDVKTSERSAFAPITPFMADNSPTP